MDLRHKSSYQTDCKNYLHFTGWSSSLNSSGRCIHQLASRRPSSVRCRRRCFLASASNKLTLTGSAEVETASVDLLEPLPYEASHELVIRTVKRSINSSRAQSTQLSTDDDATVDTLSSRISRLVYESDSFDALATILRDYPVQTINSNAQAGYIRAVLLRMLQLVKGQNGNDNIQPSSHNQSEANCLSQASTCLRCLCKTLTISGSGNGHLPQSDTISQAAWNSQMVTLLSLVMVSVQWFDSATWHCIQDVVWRSSPSLAPWNASTLLWCTSRFTIMNPSSQHLSQDTLWCNMLLDRAAAGAGKMAPSAIAQALQAAASMHHTPHRQCIEHILLHGIQQRLPEWTGGDIACVLWSLGTLRYHPGTQWLDDVLRRAEQCVRSFSTWSSIVSTLWALAVLGHAPNQSWMEHYLWQVQRKLRQSDSRGLSVMLWSLAKLRYRPPHAWALQVVTVAAQRMHALPHEVVELLNSSPGKDREEIVKSFTASLTVDDLTGNATNMSGSPSAREVTNTHSSSAAPVQRRNLAASPEPIILWPPGEEPESQSETVQQDSISQQPHPVVAQQQDSLTNSLDSRDCDGPVQGVQDSESVSVTSSQSDLLLFPLQPSLNMPPLQRPRVRHKQEDTSSSRNQQAQVSQSQSVSSQVQVDPGGKEQHSTTSSFEDSLDGQEMSSHSQPQLLHTAHSQAVLKTVTSLLREPVTWKGHGAHPRSFTTYLWALAKLQLLPRPKHLKRMCAAMSPAFPHFSPGDLAMTLWALQEIRHVPEPHMYAQLLTAVQAKCDELDCRGLAMVWHAISEYKSVVQASPSVLSSLLNSTMELLPSMTPPQTASICSSLARLHAPSSQLEHQVSHQSFSSCLTDEILTALLRQVSHQVVVMDIREGLNSALACVTLSVHTSDPVVLKSTHLLVTRMMQHCKQNFSRLNYPDLVQLLRLFVQAELEPGSTFLEQHEAAVCRFVNQGKVTPLELRPVLAGYRALNYSAQRIKHLSQLVERQHSQVMSAAVNSMHAVPSQPMIHVPSESQGSLSRGSLDTSTHDYTGVAGAVATLQLPAHILTSRQLPPAMHMLQRRALTVDEVDTEVQLAHAQASASVHVTASGTQQYGNEAVAHNAYQAFATDNVSDESDRRSVHVSSSGSSDGNASSDHLLHDVAGTEAYRASSSNNGDGGIPRAQGMDMDSKWKSAEQQSTQPPLSQWLSNTQGEVKTGDPNARIAQGRSDRQERLTKRQKKRLSAIHSVLRD